MTFLFPDLSTLHAVLLSGSLPDEVLAGPCHHGSTPAGVWIHTEVAVPDGVLAEQRCPRPDQGTDALCWAEVLPTRKSAPPDTLDEVLFCLPAERLLEVAGQLLRLGCDRQRWSMYEDKAWLAAFDPPWYTVLTEAEQGTVYRKVRPRVWAELHTDHPMLDVPSADGLLLVPADGAWQRMQDGPWTELYQALQLHLDDLPTEHEGTEVPRLDVQMRLVPGAHQDTPLFWMLEDQPLQQLESLISRVPQQTLEPLRFAALATEPPVVLLRAPSARAVPDLGLRARAFAPLLSLANTFRPVHTTLEPPLRQDAIRDLIAAQPYEVSWIHGEDDGVKVHRIHQNAFRPLNQWVDYILDRHAEAVKPWVESATFEFQEWTDIGREWATAPAKRKADTPRPERKKPTTRRVARTQTSTKRELPKRVVEPAKTDAAREALIQALTALEARFLEIDGAPDAPERVPVWTQMATLQRRIGRDREARLAWAQAAWHSTDDTVAAEWAAEELSLLDLAPEALPVDTVHAWALAACLLAGALEPTPALATLFDTADADLDARTAWSVRTRLADGDALALERARDVLLARLRAGLMRGIDTPSFLGRVDASTRETLRAHLDGQHRHFRKTKRKRSVLEAPVEKTLAYVDLVFAWGYATLGIRDRADELRNITIDRTDTVHDALISGYEARIEQALQALPRDTPLPESATARFQALSGLAKYKANRLRSASAILEPRERLDPFRAYTLEGTEQASDLQRLKGEERVARILTMLDEPQSAENAHQILLALPSLPSATATDVLSRIGLAHLEDHERVPLHADALVAAGLIGQRTLARGHATKLNEVLKKVSAEQLAEATPSLVQAFRGLRRLGLDDVAEQALEQVLAIADGKRFVDQLTRTAAAGGLALTGAVERAQPLLDKAVEVATSPFDRPVDQQRMVRTLALALASAPRPVALERLPTLAAILTDISDSFNTNSHFCFSVIDFAESIVLGYSDRQLLHDPRTRAFVLDDEFLLRQALG